MTGGEEKKAEADLENREAPIKEEANEDVIMEDETENKDTENKPERMKEDQNGDEDEDADESDEEETAEVEPLATTRSRRSNAGNLMSKIIQDEDEFYTSLYGGFNDEEEDDDFDEDNDVDSDEVEDEVDSDFSASETDEILPEHQELEDERKRKTGVYKDPKQKGHVSGQTTGAIGTTAQPKIKTTTTLSSPSKSRAERSFRDSTRKKTEETIKNINSGKKRKKLRVTEAPRKLTQEELLEEAKITEEENIRSLEVYQRSESERLKKIKQIKKTLPPPYVSYLSTTMPIIGSDGEKYSRNFVTYVT